MILVAGRSGYVDADGVYHGGSSDGSLTFNWDDWNAKHPKAKSPGAMTKGELSKETDKHRKIKDDAMNEIFQKSGKGDHEPFSAHLAAVQSGHPDLVGKFRDASDRVDMLRAETQRRTGPGTPTRYGESGGGGETDGEAERLVFSWSDWDAKRTGSGSGEGGRIGRFDKVTITHSGAKSSNNGAMSKDIPAGKSTGRAMEGLSDNDKSIHVMVDSGERHIIPKANVAGVEVHQAVGLGKNSQEVGKPPEHTPMGKLKGSGGGQGGSQWHNENGGVARMRVYQDETGIYHEQIPIAGTDEAKRFAWDKFDAARRGGGGAPGGGAGAGAGDGLHGRTIKPTMTTSDHMKATNAAAEAFTKAHDAHHKAIDALVKNDTPENRSAVLATHEARSAAGANMEAAHGAFMEHLKMGDGGKK